MKNGKVRKIVILIIVACMILTVLGCVAWKKRLGIYNTYMKMTGREPSHTMQWVLKGKEIGYHKQVIKTGKNKSETLQIADNGSNMEKVESTITQETSWVDTSLEVDQQLEEEQKNGYTWEEPLIVQNPYRYSPLTAVILFDTDEECEVRVTVKGKFLIRVQDHSKILELYRTFQLIFRVNSLTRCVVFLCVHLVR